MVTDEVVDDGTETYELGAAVMGPELGYETGFEVGVLVVEARHQVELRVCVGFILSQLWRVDSHTLFLYESLVAISVKVWRENLPDSV